MNKVILKGNLTRDPEVRQTPSGMSICEFAIAVNERWNDKQNNTKQERVHFFECVSFAGLADLIAKSFVKGKAILIAGKLQQDRWVDKQNNTNRSRVKIIVDELDFITPKSADMTPQYQHNQSGYAASGKQANAPVDNYYNTQAPPANGSANQAAGGQNYPQNGYEPPF